MWHDIKQDERSSHPEGSSPALGKKRPDLRRWRDTGESELSGLAELFSLLSFPQSQQLADPTPTCLLPTHTIQTILCIFNSPTTSSQGPIPVSNTLHKPLGFFPTSYQWILSSPLPSWSVVPDLDQVITRKPWIELLVPGFLCHIVWCKYSHLHNLLSVQNGWN